MVECQDRAIEFRYHDPQTAHQAAHVVIVASRAEDHLVHGVDDDAGQAAIQDAARRLAGQGREVRAAKLPAGKDWCDVLDTFEERAGILEFDLEVYRPEAEAQARREAVQ